MGAMTTLFSANGLALRYVTIGVLLAGCSTTSHVLIGKARPPIPVAQVTLYMEPPPKYEQIALIDASSGANGVLYQGSGDKPGAVIGTGGSNVSFGSNSAVGIGFGLSNQLMHKVVHGTAIYVTDPAPAASAAPPVTAQ
jgi:hypothetical protein